MILSATERNKRFFKNLKLKVEILKSYNTYIELIQDYVNKNELNNEAFI